MQVPVRKQQHTNVKLKLMGLVTTAVLPLATAEEARKRATMEQKRCNRWAEGPPPPPPPQKKKKKQREYHLAIQLK